MKTEISKHYACEHCSKISRSASAIVSHEKACRSNPANVNACVGCKFLKVKEENLTIGYSPVDSHYDEYNVQFNTFSCSKINQEMYPAKAKWKIKNYPESFEGKVQMPNTCEHYEVELIEENEF